MVLAYKATSVTEGPGKLHARAASEDTRVPTGASLQLAPSPNEVGQAKALFQTVTSAAKIRHSLSDDVAEKVRAAFPSQNV